MPTGRRALRIVVLLAGLAAAAARVGAAHPAAHTAEAVEALRAAAAGSRPQSLLAATDSLRAQVRLARIENVPARLLVREEIYARQLERVAAYVSGREGRADTSGVTWRLVGHLLAARHPAGAEWLAAAAAGQRPLPRAAADCAFWLGVFELGRERVAAAAAWLARPGPAHLQPYADWLRVRALDRTDEARGGALALELARGRPGHRFYNELALRAARHLLSREDSRAALALLSELVPRLPAGSQQLARAQLWSARAHLGLGDWPAMRAALGEALAGGPVGGEDPGLGLSLARAALGAGGASPELRDRCVAVLMEGAPLDEALALWRRWSGELAADLRATVLDVLLKRLNSARREGDITKLSEALAAGPDAALARRAKLEEARFRRRRGQTTAMERAFRAAAAWGEDAARLLPGDPAVGAALWEWGRELEDAERFAEAAAIYARRAVWERAAGVEPEAAMRAGLCAWRAGDREAALAHLDSACAQASPRLVAAPCFWRAVLAPGQPDAAYLTRAAGEKRPGYAARRAMLALRPAGAVGAPGPPGAIWDEVAAGVGSPRDWDWPSCPPALDAEAARRLAALIEEHPALADAAVLCEALGRRAWIKEFALTLPGAAALSPAETSALWRALGHYPAAFADAAGGGHEEYPVAFAPAVAAAARRFGLSPAFIQAVMRQESGLDPAVRSSAGAIGLMQLMPATARRVAASLGMQHFDLERPEDNVLLGTAHLVELLDQSPRNVPLCLASYNAGRGNALRWWRRVENVPDAWRHDAYLEAIGFAETRTFVRRVLRHYWGIHAAFPAGP